MLVLDRKDRAHEVSLIFLSMITRRYEIFRHFVNRKYLPIGELWAFGHLPLEANNSIKVICHLKQLILVRWILERWKKSSITIFIKL